MIKEFSVLMSLYYKEKPEYFRECMDSILYKQSVLPTEIVVVIDGPIPSDLNSVLEEYIAKTKDIRIKTVPLDKNNGLGIALREGIKECSYDLVARMDTDDVCRGDRFELQLDAFEKNPNLDICGSYIAEFIDNITNVIATRCVPTNHQKIVQYQKKRSAFNHMTVMYKKEKIISSGNYEDCPLMEDDLMWSRLILNNGVCMNIDQCLVYARTGIPMIERRGGWDYFKKYRKGRKMILKTGFISWFDYFSTVFIQFFVALLPKKMRLFFFLKVLRRKKQ